MVIARSTTRSGPEEPGDAAPPATNTKRARRNRITRNACRQCRQKKSKCDGQHPICARCNQSDSVCTYDVSEGVTKMQSLKDQLVDITKDCDRLAALLRVLVEATDQDATELLARLRLARANGEGLPEDLPAYLDPQLFRDSRTLSSLFNVPHNDGSQQYSRNGSIANQSSLDNDSSRMVSSPEEPNSAFTHWGGFNATEDYDDGSSHTTGSPSSTTLDVSPSNHQEVPSSNFGTQGGQFDGNGHQRMSSTMPGWPYNYVTGASGPDFYSPMATNGVECRNWVPEGQNGGSTYHVPQQGQPWGGQ